ncbi:MAG: flagellar hook assembly protein FlgD [Gallionella sp.]|nr:flagellar hook assembly protein FlgD [Gallionella sp.]
MITTTNTNNAAALYSALNASSSSAGNPAVTDAANTQDRFLTLLVTQMRNQDPLNPMDNAQVTSQMAQLSTVSGIDKLNATLQALSSSMTATQSMQAATMIGHGVLTPGNTVNLANGTAVGGVELAQSVDNLQVTIKDALGATVRTLDLGAMNAGVQGWQWDGLNSGGAAVPAGSYSFDVAATQGGDAVAASALTFGIVNGVTQTSSGASLNIGANGLVPMTQVKQIL